MYKHAGLGLAAPQVGVSLRVFIACPATEPSRERIYVNPEIIHASGSQEGDEGCLSFPGIFCKIKRNAKATIRAQDLEGAWFEESADGLLARAFQHEADHLDGRLLIDRMSTVARISNRRALKDLELAFSE